MVNWLQRISPVLKHVGQIETPVDWIEPARVIYDHQLVMFFESSFVVSVEDFHFRCRHGDFIVVPPGRVHVTQNVGARVGARVWIHFCWEQPEIDYDKVPILTYLPAEPSRDMVLKAPEYVPHHVLKGKVTSPIHAMELHRQLSFLWNFGDSHERLLARSIALELFVELMDDTANITAPAINRYSILAYKAHRIVEAEAVRNASETTNLSVLFNALDYSYEHVSRVFQQVFGIPPQQYLTQARLTRAKRLLKQSHLRINEIAYRAGYNSVPYFCRLFRKDTGMSPKAYRDT